MKLNTTHKSKTIIGIIGGHAHNTNPQALKIAEKTGEKLAQLGIAIACGGGAASLVPFKVGSREVYNYSTLRELFLNEIHNIGQR